MTELMKSVDGELVPLSSEDLAQMEADRAAAQQPPPPKTPEQIRAEAAALVAQAQALLSTIERQT